MQRCLWIFLSISVFQIAGLSQAADTIKSLMLGRESANVREITLKGQVVDGDTREIIPAALVQLVDASKNSITDEHGNFEFNLFSGTYLLKISYLGYEDFTVRISIFENSKQQFSLISQAINLREVTVNQNRLNDNITHVMGGVEQMGIKNIEEKSRFLGETDVLRSLQSLAGVSSVGEGASGFNVQGGNSDENLILQDGNLIINPVHALGFFSLFHPDLVNDITLYKGDVPAKYGGRLSSVLDIKLREGNDQQFKGRGGLGIATSRLALEGPIVKNKASFIVGARASYFDWILKRVNNLDLRKSNAFFYDLTGKFDARLTKTTKLGGSLFGSEDNFRFSDEVKFDYETQTGTLYLKQLIGKKINLNLLLNIGHYTSRLYDIEGNNQSKFENGIHYVRASLISYFQVSKQYALEAGMEQNQYGVSPGKISPIGSTSIIKSESLNRDHGRELAFFIHNQVKLGKKLEFIAGLRYTQYQNYGADEVYLYQEGEPKSEITINGSLIYERNKKIKSYGGMEPRFSFRYSINENNSIKWGVSKSYQYFSQISNTASAAPIDIWQVSNTYVKPQKATNFSLGYYRNDYNNTIQTKMSLFYRKIDQLIEYKDFATLLLNDHIETELVNGIGKAYGVEFSFSKVFGKHRFDGNYTYSRSLRKIEATDIQVGINNGSWYSSNFDKPHILNWNYQLKADDKNSFSVNFTYSTGRPTTAPVSSYSNGNIFNIPIYSSRNEYRIPDFHRLDIAYTIGPWGKHANRENSLTISIYNVYGRKNAFSVFFKQKAFEKVTAYRIAVLGTIFPALTYNFKF